MFCVSLIITNIFVGGFISETIGFRYIFVVLAALAGFSALIGIPFLRETYAPVLRARAARQRAFDVEATVLEQPGKELFGTQAQSKVPSSGEVLRSSLTRPIVMLSTNFICFILSLFMALWVVSFIYLIIDLMYALGYTDSCTCCSRRSRPCSRRRMGGDRVSLDW